MQRLYFRFIYLRIFILLVASITAMEGVARSKSIIGYGSSDAVYPSKNQEFFYMGFLLGFNRRIKKQMDKDFLAVKAMNDKDPFGALHSARYLKSQGIDLLVGFPTSHEALLVSEFAAKNKLLFISAAASHSDLAKFGPLIHTMVPSSQHTTQHLLKFIQKKAGKKTGLIISNPGDLFSMNHHHMVFDLMDKSSSSILKLEPAYLNDRLRLDKQYIEMIRRNEIKYLYITSYTTQSVKLLEQLNECGIDLPIFTTTSWTVGDIEYLRRLLWMIKSKVYSVSLWSTTNKEFMDFAKTARKVYGNVAPSEMAMGYDLGIVVAETINHIKGTIDGESIKNAFLEMEYVDGTSCGRIHINKKGGHAERKIEIVEFDLQKGFVTAK
jgi:ABC-type branched-subunit amino acid transport system substrate-binding protein